MEEKVTVDFELDDTVQPEERIVTPLVKEEAAAPTQRVAREPKAQPINILRNERIIVRHIPKESGMVTDPRHVLYGGMAENAVRVFVTPKLRSGAYVNVLTDVEKEYLEDAMGLEYNALSIFKKVNNYWDEATVRLTKSDNYLNLSEPDDFIKYKILLANKDLIAPSLSALQDSPKATYQFVLIAEGEESKSAKDTMNATMKCYKEYGKIENDIDILRVIIETIDGRPTAASSKLEFLQNKINNLIQADSKLFLRVITDPYLSTKVLIKKGVEAGTIVNKDGHFYLREDNTPLCGPNEEATLNIAAKFLNMPRHQDLLFALQAKLKD